jgi:hypothetical protein
MIEYLEISRAVLAGFFIFVFIVLSVLDLTVKSVIKNFIFILITLGVLWYSVYDSYRLAHINMDLFKNGKSLICKKSIFDNIKYNVSSSNWSLRENTFIKDDIIIRTDKCKESEHESK